MVGTPASAVGLELRCPREQGGRLAITLFCLCPSNQEYGPSSAIVLGTVKLSPRPSRDPQQRCKPGETENCRGPKSERV